MQPKKTDFWSILKPVFERQAPSKPSSKPTTSGHTRRTSDRFWNRFWTIFCARNLLQNRPSEFANVRFWGRSFAQKVVKSLRCFGVRTHHARTHGRNEISTHLLCKPPRYARGISRSRANLGCIDTDFLSFFNIQIIVGMRGKTENEDEIYRSLWVVYKFQILFRL